MQSSLAKLLSGFVVLTFMVGVDTPAVAASSRDGTPSVSSASDPGWFSFKPVQGARVISSAKQVGHSDGAVEPLTAPTGSYGIYKTLKCNCYNGQSTIVDRVGYYDASTDAGFGRAKHLEKHNMYVNVVGVIVAGPNHSAAGGKSGLAYAYANRKVDDGVQQIKIYSKYDTRELRDGRSFGIVTGYCEGYVRCPQWVNEIPQ